MTTATPRVQILDDTNVGQSRSGSKNEHNPVDSLVVGSETPELWHKTIGTLVDEQAERHGHRMAVVVPWQNKRLSYQELCNRSKLLAKAFLDHGLTKGDCIGIMAGNRYEYIEAFLGAARLGCPYVVLNTTYTPDELVRAVAFSECKMLLIATRVGTRSLSAHIEAVSRQKSPELRSIALLPDKNNEIEKGNWTGCKPYSELMDSVFTMDRELYSAERRVSVQDVVNLQFTSGTTGSPKAAMLTHLNLVNNARFVGDYMRLTPDDIVCCPPPLFHCFGLVMGFLGAWTHGASIVFPSDQFDASLVMDAVESEKCTTLLGVPTMFVAELEASRKRQNTRPYALNSLRKALAAGSSVPAALVRELEETFGLERALIAYGMTETSPVTFMTGYDDARDKRLGTVGTVFPHTRAKVVDGAGNTVARGVAGELCTSGYALQKGYWRSGEKTAEVMRVHHDDGRLWMHTGDECVVDREGFCVVTGRIKDIIIRGGENIFPQEIESRLVEHDAIVDASVVGLKDKKYGEAVAAFLKQAQGVARPEPGQIQRWVRQKLGAHKAPKYVFWIGDVGVGQDFPKTGSGKHQKHKLRALGDRLVAGDSFKAKL